MLMEQSVKVQEERIKSLEGERKELKACVHEKEAEMKEKSQSFLAQDHLTKIAENKVGIDYFCMLCHRKLNNYMHTSIFNLGLAR